VMLGIWLLRRYVVKPRVGAVRFGSFRKTRLLKFNLIMLIANLIAFGLGTWACIYYFLTPRFSEVSFFDRFFNYEVMMKSGPLLSVLFGFICLTMLSFAAYYLHSNRLYVYGLLVGLSPLVGESLWRHGIASHHGLPITFGISAGIMIVTGLFVFIRLLRNNPIPTEASLPKEA